MIDVIIPHYNGAHLIHKLLGSIRYENSINVYVVDDHSDQEQFRALESICNNYAAVRLLKVPNGQKGPGKARNFGIKHSSSKWLLFADADDFFTENAWDEIKKVSSKDFDMVCFSPSSETDTGLPSDRHEQYQQLVTDFINNGDRSVFFRFYPPWSKLVSRELVVNNEIEFDDGIGGEDNIFSLKCAFYANKILAIDSSIYTVVESEQSLTSGMSLKTIENHFYAMSRYNDFLQQHKLKAYQAPMTGWVFKLGRKSPFTGMRALILCLKEGYPLSVWHYFFKKV